MEGSDQGDRAVHVHGGSTSLSTHGQQQVCPASPPTSSIAQQEDQFMDATSAEFPSRTRWHGILEMVFQAMHVNGFLRRGSGLFGDHDSSDSTTGSDVMQGTSISSSDDDHVSSNNRSQLEPLLLQSDTAMLMMDDEDEDENEVSRSTSIDVVQNKDHHQLSNGSAPKAMMANSWPITRTRSTVIADRLHNNMDLVELPNDVDSDLDDCMIATSMPMIRNSEAIKFPKEKCKTLMALVFGMVCIFLNAFTLAIVHERLPEPKESRPLPDVVLDLLPQYDWALDVSEVLIMSSALTMLVVIFLHKHRFIVLRRFCLMFGVLYLMRALSMLVTQVPVSSTTIYCSSKANSTSPRIIFERVVELASGMGMSMNGHQNYCGDYIYSGHTVALTICYLIIQEYTPRRCFLLHWLSWLASVSGVCLVLVAHGHYTIDVLLAYYVTTRVFYMYHTMANNLELKTASSSTNYLSRVWWFFIFEYFERNVKDRVPRQYDWPWPRRFLKGKSRVECEYKLRTLEQSIVE